MSKYKWFDDELEREMEIRHRKKHHHHKDKEEVEGTVVIYADKVNIYINQEEKHKKKY